MAMTYRLKKRKTLLLFRPVARGGSIGSYDPPPADQKGPHFDQKGPPHGSRGGSGGVYWVTRRLG